MNKRFIAAMLMTITAVAAEAQNKADSVVVPLAQTSKIIFVMENRSDLEILKHYNFQELFQDILIRLEKNDSTGRDSTQNETVATTRQEENWNTHDSENSESRNGDDEDDDDWEHSTRHKRGRIGRTWQSFNFDLGTNNYLSDGKFPDGDNALYSVRPWGSWYLAASSIQRTRVGRNFFLEWGLALSWYNFKFQNDDVMLEKTDDGVVFTTDTREVDHIKSKLTASYVNFSLVPVLDFGDHNRKPRMWDGYGSEFRIGIGPYVGYRVASRSKLVFDENGDKEREKNRNSFYLNNFRYGARLQLGFRSTDLFFNYDLNELFTAGKGPKLNAFSFGVIF